MALLNRDNNIQPNIKNTADVSRKLLTTKEYKASERKTIKIDPPVYDLIKILSNFKQVRMYDLISQMADMYLDEKISERQKESILMMLAETHKK